MLRGGRTAAVALLCLVAAELLLVVIADVAEILSLSLQAVINEGLEGLSLHHVLVGNFHTSECF